MRSLLAAITPSFGPKIGRSSESVRPATGNRGLCYKAVVWLCSANQLCSALFRIKSRFVRSLPTVIMAVSSALGATRAA